MNKTKRKPETPRQRAAQRIGRWLDQREAALAEIEERCRRREALERRIQGEMERWRCDQVAHNSKVYRLTRPRTDRPRRLYEVRSACDAAMVAPAGETKED